MLLEFFTKLGKKPDIRNLLSELSCFLFFSLL